MQGIWRDQLTNPFSYEGLPQDDARTVNDVQAWPFGPAMIVDPADGKIPYQPWAAKLRDYHYLNYSDPNGRCHVPGVPRDHEISPIHQLIQPEGGEYVVWLLEEVHAYRVIPTDGRSHIGKNIKLWTGDSVGRWEGNTLVVDVTNVNGYAWFEYTGNFYTDQAHFVERWTMIDPNTMHYEVTVTDPKAYTRPWKMAWALVRDTQPFELLEEGCWEGERDRRVFGELGFRSYFGETHRGRVPLAPEMRPPAAR